MKWVLLLVFFLPNNEEIKTEKIEFETKSLCEAAGEEFKTHIITRHVGVHPNPTPRSVFIHPHCLQVRE